jgi:hypothetical protein
MSSGYSNRFTFACLPRTERGQPIVLGQDPQVGLSRDLSTVLIVH